TLAVDGSGSSAVSSSNGESDWGTDGVPATVTFSNLATGTFNGDVYMGGGFFTFGNQPASVNITSGAKLSVGSLSLDVLPLLSGSSTLNVQGAGSMVSANTLLDVEGDGGSDIPAINIGTTSSGAVLDTSSLRIFGGTVTIGNGANNGTLNASGDVFV